MSRRFAPRNDRGEVSLRTSALPPLTPGMFPRALRATSFQPLTRFCLLHVIASQCAHWCGNPFSPQGNLASWHYFGQIRMHFPVFALGAALCFVLPQENGLSRRFAPRNDRGEVSLRATSLHPLTPGMFPRALRAASLHPRTRPSFCMSLRASARWNRGAPVRPGEGDAVERLKTWLFRRKSQGEGCVACIAEVWQSVLPAGKPGRPVLLRANSYALSRIRLRRCSLLCATAGERIAPSLRSSQ